MKVVVSFRWGSLDLPNVEPGRAKAVILRSLRTNCHPELKILKVTLQGETVEIMQAAEDVVSELLRMKYVIAAKPRWHGTTLDEYKILVGSPNGDWNALLEISY